MPDREHHQAAWSTACADGAPYLSHQTAQDYEDVDDSINRPARAAVADFCEWFDYYAERFVHQLIDNESLKLSISFKALLRDRMQNHFPFVAHKIPRIEHLCQPFFSTFTPSKEFGPIADEQHANPSILFNFGQPALLQLTEYNCSIELQPLDIVFYHPERLKVKLVRLGNRSAEHWWIACYFQRAFMQGQLPDDDIYAHTCQARERKKQQEPDYFGPRGIQEAQEPSLDSIEDSRDTAQGSTEPANQGRAQIEMQEDRAPKRLRMSSSRV